MRYILLIHFTLISFVSVAQNAATQTFKRDTLLVIRKQPAKGFHHEYILFIPKGTPIIKRTVLLVEPNNTGAISDSIEVHKNAAIHLASRSSVGNNVSTELKIPLLVPIFPRPAAKPLMYTHALDRDAMLEKSTTLKRLDLQLLAMIKDAGIQLARLGIRVEPKFFMNGFSASGTFTNRFSLIHPEKLKAVALGGFNGEIIAPQKEIKGIKLNYPLGIHDFNKLFGKAFDVTNFQTLPQFIYMGALDDNDAVQFDDAYDETERRVINQNIGDSVQKRFIKCQEIYRAKGVNAIFKTYNKIGHWTTGAMNLEVIKFFLAEMDNK